MQPALKHKLLAGGLAAGAVLGLGAVAGAASGVGPFETDDAPTLASGSAGTGGTAVTGDTGVTQPTQANGAETESRQLVDLPLGAIQTFPAGPAGTVTIARGEGVLAIAGVTPATGFVVDEQDVDANEVEVRFVSGGVVVRFDAEIEDGLVRIRVRQRGAVVTGDTTPTSLTPATVDDDDDDDHGDRSGPGGGEIDDDDPDNSGPGSASSGSGSSGSGGSDSSGHGGGDD